MTPADLQRIAFVTRRFGDLQGLRTVAFGAALLVGVTIRDVAREFGDAMLFVAVFAGLLGSGARSTLDGYYRRTFGSTSVRPGVDWRTLPPRSHFMFLPDAVVSALTMDVMLTAFLDVRIGIGGIVLFVWCLRTIIHDWPHRAYYAIGAVAGVTAVITISLAPPRLASATQTIDPRISEYLILACGVIGLALVVIGLLDHRLLVHAMWRRPSGDRSDHRPATHLATTRIVLAGSVATAIAMHFLLSGWPLHRTIVLSILGTFMLVLLMFGGAWPDMSYGFRAIKARAREREADLLARIEGRAVRPVKETPMNEIPCPDFWGHLALPVVIACGAFADIPLRGSGLPSFLALAVAASHLRIAIRDWPDRKHYLLGAAAAAVGAVQHMFIATVSPLDWAVSFLMLLSIAMLIEGLLDRRLESHPRHILDHHHANTV